MGLLVLGDSSVSPGLWWCWFWASCWSCWCGGAGEPGHSSRAHSSPPSLCRAQTPAWLWTAPGGTLGPHQHTAHTGLYWSMCTIEAYAGLYWSICIIVVYTGDAILVNMHRNGLYWPIVICRQHCGLYWFSHFKKVFFTGFNTP